MASPDLGRAPYPWRVHYYGLAKWRYFEFWPPSVFYLPVFFYYLWLSFKFRGPLVPSCANPAIENGGLIGESKDGILGRLDSRSDFILKHRLFFPGPEIRARIEAFLEEARISYPIILKPDAGQRGSGVRLVGDPESLGDYLADLSFPVIVQEYCDYPGEVGVFYYRTSPTEPGTIFSVTRKEFPVVIGDGVSTLASLILADGRARWMARTFFHRHRRRLADVVPAGTVFRLVESGNHCQGAVFYDGRELASAQLAESLDRVCRELGEFYVGRFDLRFSDPDSLRRGRFKVIEINGAGAEATHIYDPKGSLVSAYRTLFAQWQLIFSIGAQNRARGALPISAAGFISAWRGYAKLKRRHPPTT